MTTHRKRVDAVGCDGEGHRGSYNAHPHGGDESVGDLNQLLNRVLVQRVEHASICLDVSVLRG